MYIRFVWSRFQAYDKEVNFLEILFSKPLNWSFFVGSLLVGLPIIFLNLFFSSAFDHTVVGRSIPTSVIYPSVFIPNPLAIVIAAVVIAVFTWPFLFRPSLPVSIVSGLIMMLAPPIVSDAGFVIALLLYAFRRFVFKGENVLTGFILGCIAVGLDFAFGLLGYSVSWLYFFPILVFLIFFVIALFTVARQRQNLNFVTLLLGSLLLLYVGWRALSVLPQVMPCQSWSNAIWGECTAFPPTQPQTDITQVSQLKETSLGPRIYKTSGYVVGKSNCYCPSQSFCEPCTKYILISATKRIILGNEALTGNELHLQTNDVERFTLGQKYTFTVQKIVYTSSIVGLEDTVQTEFTLLSAAKE